MYISHTVVDERQGIKRLQHNAWLIVNVQETLEVIAFGQILFLTIVTHLIEK